MSQKVVLCSALVLAALTTFVHGTDKDRTAPARAELPAPAALVVTPATVTLRGPDDVQRLAVTGATSSVDAPLFDYSRQAVYTSADAKVVDVTADGLLQPRGNGKTMVHVKVGDKGAQVQVSVADFGTEATVSFRNQIVPIFTRHGCNAGGCHGKATG
jgi:hypothetical protein